MAVSLPLVAALLVGGTAISTLGDVGIALAAAAFLVVLLLALPLGMLAAWHQHRLIDRFFDEVVRTGQHDTGTRLRLNIA